MSHAHYWQIFFSIIAKVKLKLSWMSSSKKDHEGTGVAKGRPSSMKAAAVSEERTPRSPQKVEKPFHREGSGRGRGGGAEGGQQGKKKPTTKEERRAIQVSLLCNLTPRLSHVREWNKINNGLFRPFQ